MSSKEDKFNKLAQQNVILVSPFGGGWAFECSDSILIWSLEININCLDSFFLKKIFKKKL